MNCPRFSVKQKSASSSRHVPRPDSLVVFRNKACPMVNRFRWHLKTPYPALASHGDPKTRSQAMSRSSLAFLSKSRAQLGLVVAVVSLIPSHAEAHRRTSQPTITTPTQRVSRWETK